MLRSRIVLVAAVSIDLAATAASFEAQNLLICEAMRCTYAGAGSSLTLLADILLTVGTSLLVLSLFMAHRENGLSRGTAPG